MTYGARRQSRGFTLLELVLVLLILCIAAATAAPSLVGWGRASTVRDAGDQFLAVARWARTQALADSTIYRLNVDSREGTYWVTMQDGMNYVKPGSEFGRVFRVPDGFSIAMTNGCTSRSTAISSSSSASCSGVASRRPTRASYVSGPVKIT